MKIIHSTCPLDCYDTCGLFVYVEDGVVKKIMGDPEHPLTRGFLCSKGYRHSQRLYSKERIKKPQLKVKGQWKEIEWAEAYEVFAKRVGNIIHEYGSEAILHYSGAGSGGILQGLSKRFTQALGGVTGTEGSICWGSGYQGQKLDFGSMQIHDWSDVLNTRLVVLWGRDPETTNMHFVPFLREAIEKGTRMVVINPIQTKGAEKADLHITPKLGTDGALALAMAHVIIKENLYDLEFVQKHTANFQDYQELVGQYSPEQAEKITGIKAEVIENLARVYAQTKPAAIFFGFGMQRYQNGGRAVRAIDALAALTGNIGVSGGGANYCHQLWKGFFNDIEGNDMVAPKRKLKVPILGDEIIQATDPPIKAIIITAANPVNQLPNTPKVKKAFQKTDFVCVVDMFMTDTAEMADLILPCTSFLEEDNLIFSSWNYYLGSVQQAVVPVGEAKPDAVIFTELAQKMNLPGFHWDTPEKWLDWALEPARQKYGITRERLAKGAVRHPQAAIVPWESRIFDTPSGKFVFCLDPYELGYEPPCSEYPFQLLTIHQARYMHSQFQNLDINKGQEKEYLKVYIHSEEGERYGFKEGEIIKIITPRGSKVVEMAYNNKLPAKVALIYQGRWLKHGGGINVLTPDFIPDLGPGTAFYDCHCRLEGIKQ